MKYFGKYVHLEKNSYSYETQASNSCLNTAQMKRPETCSIAWDLASSDSRVAVVYTKRRNNMIIGSFHSNLDKKLLK